MGKGGLSESPLPGDSPGLRRTRPFSPKRGKKVMPLCFLLRIAVQINEDTRTHRTHRAHTHAHTLGLVAVLSRRGAVGEST